MLSDGHIILVMDAATQVDSQVSSLDISACSTCSQLIAQIRCMPAVTGRYMPAATTQN